MQVTQYRRNVLKRFSLNSSSSVYNTLQFIKLLFQEPELKTVAKVNFTCYKGVDKLFCGGLI